MTTKMNKGRESMTDMETHREGQAEWEARKDRERERERECRGQRK